jgi:hypothetical protein
MVYHYTIDDDTTRDMKKMKCFRHYTNEVGQLFICELGEQLDRDVSCFVEATITEDTYLETGTYVLQFGQ